VGEGRGEGAALWVDRHRKRERGESHDEPALGTFRRIRLGLDAPCDFIGFVRLPS
jgi:hypothetical protein